MKHLSLRLGAPLIALVMLTLPAEAFQMISPPTTAAKASKMFKKLGSKATKECKANLKDVAKDACEEIDALRDALGEGTSPTDIADALNTTMSLFHNAALSEVGSTHTQISNAATSALSNFFEDELPAGFVTGECNTIDKLNADIAKELQKTTDKVMKKIKKLMKEMSKKHDTNLTASLMPPDPPAVTPDPPEPVKKKLASDTAAASNDNMGGESGQLCLGGTYDPSEGTEISITVLDVGGENLTKQATVDPETCRWKVCFGAGHDTDDPLPEGNYAIEIDQLKGVDFHTTDGGVAGVP